MNFLLFIPYYIKWHYSKALKDIFGLWQNTFIFVQKIFSMKLLSHTLFSPWKRMGELYKKNFDLNSFITTFIFNTLLRIMGFIARGFILLLGIFFMLIAFIFGVLFFVIWLFLPFILFYILYEAISEILWI